MVDWREKAQLNKPLSGWPAKAYNKMLDVAEAVDKGNSQGFGAVTTGNKALAPGEIFVNNGTGTNGLPAGTVFGLDDLAITPTDNQHEYENNILFDGVTPADPDHIYKFAVAIEAAQNSGPTRCQVSGPARVQLLVNDSTHEFAKVKDGDYTRMETAESEGVAILWAAGTSGTVDAIVHLDKEFVSSGTQCLNNNPEIYAMVTGSVTDRVDWVGRDWFLPADSGREYLICPSAYRYNTADGYHTWAYPGVFTGTPTTYVSAGPESIFLEKRTGNATAGAWGKALLIWPVTTAGSLWPPTKYATTGTIRDDRGGYYTASAIYYLNLYVLPGTKTNGTTTLAIEDAFFGSYTIGGVTYSWRRGNGWP